MACPTTGLLVLLQWEGTTKC